LGYIIAEKSGGFRGISTVFTKEALNQFKNKEKCVVSKVQLDGRKLKRKRQQLLMKERLLIPISSVVWWWIRSMLLRKKETQTVNFH
jgi:hypothetical protein